MLVPPLRGGHFVPRERQLWRTSCRSRSPRVPQTAAIAKKRILTKQPWQPFDFLCNPSRAKFLYDEEPFARWYFIEQKLRTTSKVTFWIQLRFNFNYSFGILCSIFYPTWTRVNSLESCGPRWFWNTLERTIFLIIFSFLVFSQIVDSYHSPRYLQNTIATSASNSIHSRQRILEARIVSPSRKTERVERIQR